ncbi:YkgJ family cysteine cluster protein [Massilia sp. Dwa41.01b]|uniref:YkgJ family cysteine cluster protein n=1 Tax=unclassified Massilia TaxID=2609279 RepID=UPI001603604F|nr:MULTISPECIES: YkgJ family cysteine cluster protein [unclassified Massilia]QNA89302.1 YkgJ family cysteine cluster protein [Massilia sp. Dwa41.01b]QNB00204.1 YkgJ family cysteine cluster protein [Massilia sp. Se16.2.3]
MTGEQVREPFPCNGRGKCCRRVDGSTETAWLDRGDGTCRHFDEPGKRCTIYAQRPLVCRVEAYYEQHLSGQVSWPEFVRINLAICATL